MTFLDVTRALRRWLDEQNFPESEKLSLVISCATIDGVARLYHQINSEHKTLTTGSARPINWNKPNFDANSPGVRVTVQTRLSYESATSGIESIPPTEPPARVLSMAQFDGRLIAAMTDGFYEAVDGAWHKMPFGPLPLKTGEAL